MKHSDFSREQQQKAGSLSGQVAPGKPSQDELDFVPSVDEVSRKAYFTYVNQGSRQGHEVEHWLAAEAELIAERNLTRIHGFHNKN